MTPDDGGCRLCRCGAKYADVDLLTLERGSRSSIDCGRGKVSADLDQSVENYAGNSAIYFVLSVVEMEVGGVLAWRAVSAANENSLRQLGVPENRGPECAISRSLHLRSCISQLFCCVQSMCEMPASSPVLPPLVRNPVSHRSEIVCIQVLLVTIPYLPYHIAGP